MSSEGSKKRNRIDLDKKLQFFNGGIPDHLKSRMIFKVTPKYGSIEEKSISAIVFITPFSVPQLVLKSGGVCSSEDYMQAVKTSRGCIRVKR